MKDLKRLIASALMVTMVLTAASCGKAPEETEEETSTSETTTTEETTTSETTEETTTETSEETEDTEESTEVTSPDGEAFDPEEYPFDISEDTFVSATKDIGGNVYYDVDDFMDVYNGIGAADSDALDKYYDGIAIVSSGDDISDMIDTIATTATSKNDEFNDHLTNLCIFTAAEVNNMDYQIIVMYYEVDDPAIVEDWYANASAEYIDGISNIYPASDYYDVTVNLYDNGDSKALISKCVLNDTGAGKYGEPAGSGVYAAFYINGTSGIFFTATDFTDDTDGFDMIDEFCDEMGLMNPRDI